MDSDLLSSVTELTQRLQRERETLVRALARAREIHDGTDESGSITLLVDEDGTARDIRVAQDWRRRVSPARLGAAVVAADGEAARRRATATAEELATPSTSDADESTQDVEARRTAGAMPGAGWLMPVPSREPAADPARPRRSLAEISAAVLAAFEDLERFTEPPPPVHGAGAQGAVRITLAQGRITECVINQAWLARQDDVTLAHALREAVSAAALASATARRPFLEYQQRLDAIVAEARANLTHFTRGDRS